MTQNSAATARVQTLVDFGFTERQARFLVLVMRHAGVCVPRQYASAARIAHGGRRCNAFFDTLVRRGYAVRSGCVHNRARLYHVHHRGLYAAIGEGSSRYRRRVSPRVAVLRLMLLDAVLTTPDLEWLTTAAERGAYLSRLRASARAATGQEVTSEPESKPAVELPGTWPIGVEPDGRTILLYLATEPSTDGFRSFLQRHMALLRVAPTWTLRIVFPHPLDRVSDAYHAVIREELESPLHRATIGELQWYFEHRRRAAREPVHPETQGLVNVGAKVFGTPRFTEMYRRWLKHGNAVFEGPSSPVIHEALSDGRGRVESVVLAHSYRHLSPLADDAAAPPERAEKGLRRGNTGGEQTLRTPSTPVLNPSR